MPTINPAAKEIEMTKKLDPGAIAGAYVEQARQRRLRRNPAFQARAVRQLRRELRAEVGRRLGKIAKAKLTRARALQRRLKQTSAKLWGAKITHAEAVAENLATWEEIVQAGPDIEEVVLVLVRRQAAGAPR